MAPCVSASRGVTVRQGTPPMTSSVTTMSSGVDGVVACSAARMAVSISAVGRASGVCCPVAMICSTIASCSTLGAMAAR